MGPNPNSQNLERKTLAPQKLCTLTSECGPTLQDIYGVEQNERRAETEEEREDRLCVICLVNERNTTVLPCRHMCMCDDCAQELRKQDHKCPICRVPVRPPQVFEGSSNTLDPTSDAQAGPQVPYLPRPGAPSQGVVLDLEKPIFWAKFWLEHQQTTSDVQAGPQVPHSPRPVAPSRGLCGSNS